MPECLAGGGRGVESAIRQEHRVVRVGGSVRHWASGGHVYARVQKKRRRDEPNQAWKAPGTPNACSGVRGADRVDGLGRVSSGCASVRIRQDPELEEGVVNCYLTGWAPGH